MSIKDRRNAVLKSSISLNSIRDSVTSFGKGISQSISKANEIVKQTRKSNCKPLKTFYRPGVAEILQESNNLKS